MIRSSVFSALLVTWLSTAFPATQQSLSAQTAAAVSAADSIQVQTPTSGQSLAQTQVETQVKTQVQTPEPAPAQSPTQHPSQAAIPVARPPVPPPSAEDLADSLVMHQRYQEAIATYRKASSSAAIWNKMGIAYQMMFNVNEAMHCYKESLKLDSNNAQVVNNLATIYDSEKEYSQAERLYRKSVKLDPDSAMVYKNLGTNLLAQHKYSRGWDAYQRALALDPEIFEDHGTPQVQNPASITERGAMNYYMALGCVRIGQTECALQYLRMAIDEGFTSPKKVASDVAFASLRDNADFKQLLASQQNAKPEQAR